MSKLHKPGTYAAKIVDYGIWKGQKGPMAAVMFEYINAEGGKDRLTWFGSFNGGAREFTVEALVRMGFAGKNGSELNKGNGSGVLDQEKTYDIVVDNEMNPKKNELQSRVKSVYLQGGSAFREKLADGEANTLMGGLNLEADFMEARSRVGVKQAASQQAAAPHPSPMMAPMPSEEDLPF